MEFDPIEEVSLEQRLLQQMAKRRTCAMLAADSREAYPSKLGTGTAVAHAGHTFVVSCSHVVDNVYSGGVGWLAFFAPQQQVGREECEVVLNDRQLDLAVLRLTKQAAARLTELRPLQLQDLAAREAFESTRPGDRVAFTGLPGKLLTLRRDTTVLDAQSFTLESVVVSRRQSELLLDYQHATRNGVAFDPRGSSGALVYQLFSTAPSSDLWRPGLAVAVLHHWSAAMEDLQCSSVHHVREAIEVCSGS